MAHEIIHTAWWEPLRWDIGHTDGYNLFTAAEGDDGGHQYLAYLPGHWARVYMGFSESLIGSTRERWSRSSGVADEQLVTVINQYLRIREIRQMSPYYFKVFWTPSDIFESYELQGSDDLDSSTITRSGTRGRGAFWHNIMTHRLDPNRGTHYVRIRG
jgi:hypothetical protein